MGKLRYTVIVEDIIVTDIGLLWKEAIEIKHAFLNMGYTKVLIVNYKKAKKSSKVI